MADLFDAAFLRKLELLTISARRAFRGQMRGEQRSPRAGSSVEFADYRQYAPGDDYRRIDWNAYARMDSLFLKLFREEEDLHLYLLCDGSGSMDFGEPGKFDYARRVSAALAYVALSNSDRVSLYLLGRTKGSTLPVREVHGPWRGKEAIFRVFDALRASQPGGQADLSASVQYLLAQKARPGIAVLCSDLLLHGGYAEAVELLVYAGFQPMIVHLLSPQEIDPPLDGDLRLLDSETGAHVDVSPNRRVRAAYQARLAAFRGQVEEFVRKRGVAYVFTSTAAPFEDLVLHWMREANLLA